MTAGELTAPFPKAGRWIQHLNSPEDQEGEMIDVSANHTAVSDHVPSNYGKLFISA